MKLLLSFIVLQIGVYTLAQTSEQIQNFVDTHVNNNGDIFINVANRTWQLNYHKDNENSTSGPLLRVADEKTLLDREDSAVVLIKMTLIPINEENIATVDYSKIKSIKTNVKGEWKRAIQKVNKPPFIFPFEQKKGLNLTLGYGSLSYLFMEEYCPKYSCNNQFISNDRSHSLYFGLSYFFKWAKIEVGYRKLDFPVVLYHKELYAEASVNLLSVIPNREGLWRVSPIFGLGKAFEWKSYYKGNYSTGKQDTYTAFGLSVSYGSLLIFYKDYQYSTYTFDYQRSMSIYEVEPKYHEIGLKINFGKEWFVKKESK